MQHMTALVSCFSRAYHHRNNKVRIFEDPAAEQILGPDYDEIARNMSEGIGFFFPGFQGTREEGLRRIVDLRLSPSVLGRSAWCESGLRCAQEEGISRYLVLAAGYDTRAIRIKDPALTVYELDRREVLEDKARRIGRAGLRSCAVNVPCDLTDPGWTVSLKEHGFLPKEKSFASLLGLSYYLTKGLFAALLHALAGLLAPGSSLCFDCPSLQGGIGDQTNRMLAAGAGSR